MAVRVTALICLAAFLNTLVGVPLAYGSSLAEEFISLGNKHYLYGEPQEAREEYRKALATRPEDSIAHHNLGVVLFEIGDLDGALTHFEQAAHADPSRAETWSNLSIVLCAKGYFDQAENIARRSIAADPDFAPAYNNLGLILEALGQPTDAHRQFASALERSPRLAEALNNLGNSLGRSHELEAARAAYDAGVLANARLAYLYFNRGLLSIRTGDYKAAVRDWERARTLDPDSAPDFVIASVALRGGDYAKAIRHFESVDGKGPMPSIPVGLDDFKPLFAPSGIIDPNLSKIRSLRKNASSKDARGAASEEPRIDPSRLSRDYTDLARVSWDRGLDERAETLLLDALELDPGYDAAREALGTLYLKQQRAEAAVTVLAPLETDSASADILVLLGDAYTKANRLEDALRLYRKAADADPRNARAHVGLGWLQIRVRQYDNGIDAIRRGISLAPKDTYARVTLADALSIKESDDHAEREYRRAIRDDSTNARAHAHYGSFLASQRRYAEAKKHYAIALENDPDTPGVVEELSRLKTRKPAKINNIFEAFLIMPLLPFIGIAGLLKKVSK